MTIKIICVGKIKESYFRGAVEEYTKRLGRYCRLTIVECADEKTPDGASAETERAIKRTEGERILRQIRDNDYCIALAIQGKSMSSEKMAARLDGLMNAGKSSVVFIIGGSVGLSQKVLDLSKERISFSKLTFPHQLMRVIFLEQLYRWFKIERGEPYHK